MNRIQIPSDDNSGSGAGTSGLNAGNPDRGGRANRGGQARGGAQGGRNPSPSPNRGATRGGARGGRGQNSFRGRGRGFSRVRDL